MSTKVLSPYTTLQVGVGADDVSLRRSYERLKSAVLLEKGSGDPQAAERVRELHDAYKLLSDSERRALYDEFGAASLRRGFDPEAARQRVERERAEQRRRAHAALLAPTAVERREIVGAGEAGTAAQVKQEWSFQCAIGPKLARYGGTLRLPVTRPVTCPRCEGSGRRDATCASCKGERRVDTFRVEACGACRGVGVYGEQLVCARCKGTTKRKGRKCTACSQMGIFVKRYLCAKCDARGLLRIRSEQPCPGCKATGLADCSRCAGQGTVGKSLMFRLYVPASVRADLIYRYAGAGFSTFNGAPTDLHIQFTILSKAPRR